MSKRKEIKKRKESSPKGVPEAIARLLSRRDSISAGEVAATAGVTRQAAHYHLSRMVGWGGLEMVGRGRAARYRRSALFTRRYPRRGLDEDQIWKEIAASVPPFGSAPDNVQGILRFAFTEMLNNAIDHSEADEIEVRATVEDGVARFAISEKGIGLFTRVRDILGLADDVAALQELSKGKVTTAPEAHTGEGLFFTSKSVDYFFVESGGLRWTIDNKRAEEAIGDSQIAEGTSVTWELSLTSDRRLDDVFREYTDDDFAFSTSRTVVRLFEYDVRFVSRSEAKRLTRNLDKFREVIVDFKGVTEVGRGFIDELFRVWQRDHPDTRLRPRNMTAPIERLVRRVSGSI